jgi:Flp pilus assembly protein TadD
VHQDAAAHCNLGLAWMGQRQEPGRAASEFRRAVEIDPSRSDCWYDLGVTLLSTGQPVPAADAFREASAVAPTFFEARIGEARALEEIGDVAGARAAYEAGRRLRPGQPDVARAIERLDARRGG